jgi:hypothetical protein
LRGAIPAGETILVAAVIASPEREAGQAAWNSPPDAPGIAALEALFKERGERVSAIKVARPS